jgi:hypothetical protein
LVERLAIQPPALAPPHDVAAIEEVQQKNPHWYHTPIAIFPLSVHKLITDFYRQAALHVGDGESRYSFEACGMD